MILEIRVQLSDTAPPPPPTQMVARIILYHITVDSGI